MTTSEIIKAMSPEARRTVENMSSALIGTVAPASRPELSDFDLIGPNGGLTIKGSAVAERLQREALDRAFG